MIRTLILAGYVLLALVETSHALGQSFCHPQYPAPDDQGLVFYLQRTGNANTVVYTANQLQDGSINPADPVDVFWRYLGGSGRKRELRSLERRVAFGVKIAPLDGQPGNYVARLNAYPSIQVKVEPTADGKVRAVMPIAGEPAQLVCIYVEWREQFGFIPKVLYVDFFGRTLDGDRKVVQRVQP